jgi:YcxB-like protein
MHIEVDGTLTVDDFVAANDMQESLYQRIGMYIDIGFIVVGVALWFTIAPRIGMLLAALGILDIVGGELWSRFVTPGKNQRMFDLLTDLHGQIVYEISDHGVRVTNQNGSHHHEWSEYLDLGEDDHIFLLCRSETMMEILPKRWFTKHETVDEFRDFALSQVLQNLELETAAESD